MNAGTTADAVLSAIRGMSHTKLTETGPNAFRCNSPLRAGSDSFAFVLEVSPDGEYGKWIDHARNEYGSLYTLAERLGIQRTSRGDGVSIRVPVPLLERYAAAHGVPVDAYLLTGWTETRHGRKPALQIQTDTGPRFRLDPNNPDAKPKYWHSKTWTACWYLLADGVALTAARGVPLVLVNGEASAVACQYHGVAAVCVTGGSEREIPAHLVPALLEAYKKPDIIVALDCDEKGRKAAPKLAAQLRAMGYAPRVVDLGLEDKQDAADYLRMHTVADFYALPDIADRVIDERRAALLSAIQTPEQIHTAIVNGTDRPARSVIATADGTASLLWVGAHILAARPKTYKSMLALHLADAVTDTSVDIFASGRFRATRGAVLYLDFEQQTATVDRRMNAMTIREHSTLQYVTSKAWRNLERANADTDRTELAFEVIRAWYVETMKRGQTPALVVVDTLSAIQTERVTPNTDTHQADYQYMRRWDDLAVELDTAVLLLMHLTKGTRGKNGADPADAVYGSGKMTGAVESIITLTRADADDAFVTMQARARDEAIQPTVLQFDSGRGHHIIPATLPVNVLNLSKQKASIVAALEDGHNTVAAIAEALGISGTAVYNAIGPLMNENYIRRGAVKGTYEATRTT